MRDEQWTIPNSKIVPKITVKVYDGTQLENVRFEDVHRGGIWVTDTDVFKKWKNVSFGDGCLSKDPAELLRTKEMPERKEYFTP